MGRSFFSQLISGDDCSEASSEGSCSLAADEETSCDITLVERLVRSHPIWFLPGIQRAGAFHLLQGKEDGVSTPLSWIRYDEKVAREIRSKERPESSGKFPDSEHPGAILMILLRSVFAELYRATIESQFDDGYIGETAVR